MADPGGIRDWLVVPVVRGFESHQSPTWKGAIVSPMKVLSVISRESHRQEKIAWSDLPGSVQTALLLMGRSEVLAMAGACARTMEAWNVDQIPKMPVPKVTDR